MSRLQHPPASPAERANQYLLGAAHDVVAQLLADEAPTRDAMSRLTLSTYASLEYLPERAGPSPNRQAEHERLSLLANAALQLAHADLTGSPVGAPHVDMTRWERLHRVACASVEAVQPDGLEAAGYLDLLDRIAAKRVRIAAL